MPDLPPGRDAHLDLLEREVDRFLGEPQRTAQAVAADLRATEAELARLEAAWLRLEDGASMLPGLRTDARLAHLRQRLASDRDAVHGRWARLLLELRGAGGRVTWCMPADVPVAMASEPAGAREPEPDSPSEPQIQPEPAPAVVAPVPATHVAVAVDDRQIQRLQAALRGENALPRNRPQPFDAQRWLDLASALGELPEGLDGEAAVRAEFRRIEKFGRPDRLQWVAELPRDVQCLLVGHLVARTRCLQEPPASHHVAALDLDKPIEALFSAWTSHQRTHQPGFVHGLGRHHAPERGHWREDARALWHALAERATLLTDEPALNPERELRALEQLLDANADGAQVVAQLDVAVAAGVAQDDPRLVRLMRPHPELVKFARFKTLRRTIRAQEVDEDAEADEPTPGPPPDWTWWHVVRERRAAILGGTPREPARARIERAFGMDELTWVQVDQHKQLDSLAQRIRAGGLDLLILLQSFASHKASDKLVDACRDSGVPFVPIEHGYGVARIQRAIEEHVGGQHLGEPVAAGV